ncbi:alkylated DNA repair protein ALKBH8 homolog isoform X2 [Nicotiana tabacum]|uniref:Alkylated DNA repair protein ALKBH8 homolog isoform X2 n=2 Tax=Nicotiana TaxID=4085 RepID=A0A1S3YQK8_TOBAC|nr:PREDICTED: alkylated DNA repair protein alkB homolog 8 isoform X2 [Nicotiana sylvestris]XP_016454260.1 PREDICTED: alkylated DNA repair protein alkB homolog 8-like isoform X2 [Nicotiana tabacum]
MGLPRFKRPGGTIESSSNLYVANCGPAVGLTFDTIEAVFGAYGPVKGVYLADESGTRVIVSYHEERSAESALKALSRRACPELGGRSLHIQYSVHSVCQVAVDDSIPVSMAASELDIPGLYLIHDFISAEEEKTRNVNANQYLGELPSFLSPILEKMSLFQKLGYAETVLLDQLTVNEYPPGVGLSPHIDTHSAFEDLIFSLSLAGPCIMEFRKYSTGVWLTSPDTLNDEEAQNSEKSSKFLRRAIYLPPRSILLLSGEARYVWHHYIPHHKVDVVNDTRIRRASRRVSFTLRKVRKGPCECEFPEYCDSQK